jgi:hypothetical protein
MFISSLAAHGRRFGPIGCLLAACLALTAVAQEPAPPVEGSNEALREQSIYIPYTKLRDVFEKDGRGVFLPYEKFQALWKAAQEAERVTPSPRPPVDALVSEITSRAQASQDVMIVESRLSIELLQEGWHKIPLRLADAAIRSARIGDQAARLVREQDGYTLLVERPKGSDVRTIELVLEYAKVIEKSPGRNSVSVQAPQAPVNRWEVHIPESGVKVDVQPLIAATQPPAADADSMETVMLAFVGAAETVRVDWNPKAEGASGLAALLSVQAEQEVVIDEGVVRTRSRLTYQISRAELTELQIEVPADHKVAGVFDPNIRQWDVATEADIQVVTVQLFEPARATQTVTIDLERFSGEAMSDSVALPMIKARNVGRQQGLVVVQLSPTLRSTTARRDGLLQLDAADLPQTVANRNWDYAFRYAALPYELALNVEKVQPRIRVEEYVHAYVEPNQLVVDLLAVYDIERAGIFQLSLDIPQGYEVRQVRGQEAEGIQAAAVDTDHADPMQAQRWLVNLARKAQGRVGLLVQLTRRLDDPNLTTPTGQSSQIPLPLPRVAAAGIEQVTGRLIVFAPESLRVAPTTQTLVQNISFHEATQAVPFLRRGGQYAAMREVLALAYARDAVDLTLSAERRKPQVQVRQFLVARIESGVVRYRATFFYEIHYSPVKVLRIDLPQQVASLARNETSSVRDEVITPAPGDVPEGYVAWQFTGETEFFGTPQIELLWDQPIDPLGIGQSVQLNVPRLQPYGADRAWGQIVATKTETIDVRPSDEPDGLRPIDPQHDLMPGVSISDAARAFEFHDDWTLSLQATRYQLVEVKRTSIENALLRMVVTRSDQVAVQALYRLRSARQRLAVRFPSRIDPQSSFDSQPARINGQSVTLEQGEDREYYIPLIGLTPEEPFLLELRYTVAGDQRLLDFPEFPDEPAVSQVALSAYLPEERTLLAVGGPWTSEQYNPWRAQLNEVVALAGRAVRDGVKSDEELYAELAAGIPVSGDTLGTFNVQGQRFLFSTLRPAPSPDGALRLRTMHSQVLNALMFLMAAGLAVVLILRPVREKLLIIGSLVVLLIAAGVFWPTAVMQLLNGKLLFAGAAVVATWFTVEAVKGTSRLRSLIPETWWRQGRTDAEDHAPNGADQGAAVRPAPESAKDDTAQLEEHDEKGGTP